MIWSHWVGVILKLMTIAWSITRDLSVAFQIKGRTCLWGAGHDISTDEQVRRPLFLPDCCFCCLWVWMFCGFSPFFLQLVLTKQCRIWQRTPATWLITKACPWSSRCASSSPSSAFSSVASRSCCTSLCHTSSSWTPRGTSSLPICWSMTLCRSCPLCCSSSLSWPRWRSPWFTVSPCCSFLPQLSRTRHWSWPSCHWSVTLPSFIPCSGLRCGARTGSGPLFFLCG